MKRKRKGAQRPVTAAVRLPSKDVLEAVRASVGEKAVAQAKELNKRKKHTAEEEDQRRAAEKAAHDKRQRKSLDSERDLTNGAASTSEAKMNLHRDREDVGEVTRAQSKRRRTKGEAKRRHAEAVALFHVLQRKLDQAHQAGDTAAAEQVQSQIDKLGGLPAYQQYSQVGAHRTGSFNTSRWVVRQLVEHGWKTEVSERKLRLLDVGALDHNYKKETSWITATPIDLHAQTPAVQCIDFFDFKPPKSAKERWDVICLCLVLNFVPEPVKRGEMLWRSANYLRDGGALFVVLPLACIENSRYTNDGVLCSLFEAVGLKMVASHKSAKLCFYMCTLETRGKLEDVPRELVRPGSDKNNFCIRLGKFSMPK